VKNLPLSRRVITGMGSMFMVLCRWEVGRHAGTSGRCIDDSEIFRVDNMESEVVGGE